MALESQIQSIATTENVSIVTDIGTKVIAFIIKQTTDFFALLQSNLWWLAVVGGLMWAENIAIDHFGLPVPAGKIRWVLLFFVTMFFSWAFVPFLSRWIV